MENEQLFEAEAEADTQRQAQQSCRCRRTCLSWARTLLPGTAEDEPDAEQSRETGSRWSWKGFREPSVSDLFPSVVTTPIVTASSTDLLAIPVHPPLHARFRRNRRTQDQLDPDPALSRLLVRASGSRPEFYLPPCPLRRRKSLLSRPRGSVAGRPVPTLHQSYRGNSFCSREPANGSLVRSLWSH